MVRIGNRTFEFIEHLGSGSKGRHLVANHNDICGIHLAFMVNDLDDAFRRVKTLLGYEPTTSQPNTVHDLN